MTVDVPRLNADLLRDILGPEPSFSYVDLDFCAYRLGCRGIRRAVRLRVLVAGSFRLLMEHDHQRRRRTGRGDWIAS